MTVATLEASSQWLETQTGASDTVKLVKSILGHCPWLQGQQVNFSVVKMAYYELKNILNNSNIDVPESDTIPFISSINNKIVTISYII